MSHIDYGVWYRGSPTNTFFCYDEDHFALRGRARPAIAYLHKFCYFKFHNKLIILTAGAWCSSVNPAPVLADSDGTGAGTSQQLFKHK